MFRDIFGYFSARGLHGLLENALFTSKLSKFMCARTVVVRLGGLDIPTPITGEH